MYVCVYWLGVDSLVGLVEDGLELIGSIEDLLILIGSFEDWFWLVQLKIW